MNSTTDEEVVTPSAAEQGWPLFLTFSAVGMTALSTVALIVNLYLLICSRYLRRPIGVNLRLCVSLTASDALCAVFYILTFLVNVFFRGYVSDCISLLLEVCKLSTFTASVFTLLALALNHYVGIVYPLQRNAITPKTVKSAIIIAYLIPLSAYLALFVIFPGGLRANPGFSIVSLDGCRDTTIYRNSVFRCTLVAPFIFFVILISFLYLHILCHMRHIAKDPLLKTNNKSKRTNRKLLVTLMLLAGSACVGWLPTSLNFVMPIILPMSNQARIYAGFISQTLHVGKLLADAFIYASRLVEIRYAMWMFNSNFCSYLSHFTGTKNYDRNVPQEFVRYLSETKENRSMRSKRVKSEMDPESKKYVHHRVTSQRFPATQPKPSSLSASHRPLQHARSNPTTSNYNNNGAAKL
ncbi:unnamed protein product [Caenorhabditis auriculariae]|uniref:G-protein coupled receptors family 1 profile domain-containing protein n=1 Tax=Caenorhabditis auriculariae TaxID=2777116 RepID=A0A8S1HG62_9PELO|nr:unnamed protein product [Caenorhabditis auriculariae]